MPVHQVKLSGQLKKLRRKNVMRLRNAFPKLKMS